MTIIKVWTTSQFSSLGFGSLIQKRKTYLDSLSFIILSNNLELNDWGKIVKPKAGGGRTTSVSIMTRDGIKKMYDNTLLVIDDQRYIDFLNKYNKSNKL